MRKKIAIKTLISFRQPSEEKLPKELSSEKEEESEVQQLHLASPGKERFVVSSEAMVSEDGDPTTANFGAEIGSQSAPLSVKKPALRAPKSSSKRAAHDEKDQSQRPAKGSKKPRIGEGEKSPGGRTTGKWSLNVEVRVLKGMIAFRDATGQNPSDDIAAFSDFVNKKLKVEIQRTQLKDRMKSLEKRFGNTMSKRKNGVHPQEDKVFKLSQKIWGDHVAVGNHSEGSKNGDTNGVKSPKRVQPVVKETGINDEDGVDERDGEDKEEENGEQEAQGKVDGEKEFGSKYPYLKESFTIVENGVPSLAMSEYGKSYMMKSLRLIRSDKAKELNEKWKQIAVKEIELNHEKMNLMKEQIKLVKSV